MRKAIRTVCSRSVPATLVRVTSGLSRIRKLLGIKSIENRLHMFAHRKFRRIGIMIANRFQDRLVQLTSKLIFTLSRCCANHLGQYKFVNHFHQVLHQNVTSDLDQPSMKAEVEPTPHEALDG